MASLDQEYRRGILEINPYIYIQLFIDKNKQTKGQSLQ